MISNLFVTLGKHFSNGDIQPDLIRHFVLNSLRSYNSKFKAEYGELVIACDTGSSWRKDVFPYYKANRKTTRDASTLDWSAIFKVLDQIKAELKEYFPYRVIGVPGAEADDVIGTLAFKFEGTNEKILILSGDKDFRQLQVLNNVKQYDPTRKKWNTELNPEAYLKEHIIRGDKGDGVPSILGDDDSLVLGKRSGTLTKKRFDAFMAGDMDEKTLRNYKRNEQLVNLEFIPQNIRDAILVEFENQAGKGRDKLWNYFITNKLKNLLENINDF